MIDANRYQGHTDGPWTLTHIEGTNFAVQEFELRGMFGDKPNVYPIFNKDRTAIDGTTFCCSPEDALLIADAPMLLGECLKLQEKVNRYRQALERIAQPALGGKQQQYIAQQAFAATQD